MFSFNKLPLAALVFAYSASISAQQTVVPINDSIADSFALLSEHATVKSMLELIEAQEAAYIEEQLRLTEIPAPPFKEQVRAAYFLEQMKTRGLVDAYIDSEGNAIGIRKGTGAGPTFLIAAHLDTVFPEGVDTTVELRNGRYYAPGIGDDTRGLAALLSVIDALNQSGLETVGGWWRSARRISRRDPWR